MSKTVDERVVSMEFDNRQFEQNVRTSMSTLEKLKQSLNLNGAAKGLENVNAAAKGVNINGLGNAVQEVHNRFSALEIMGVTALANITNSAVNCGKKMMSALTIDPIKTGFQEYETQINSVQTILANTQSKGSTIDDVNKALDELNKYADLTIYNFTEMTRNIGTFTAAGVDLETSVSAIQGIANLAAVSGSTSQQASTAMHQLSQALAAGTVKLTDWNSVVTAGMGGEVFQTALRKTSELLGTGAEAAIEAQGSFRESLHTGWLTSEVLTETLKKFTTSGANEYVAEYTGLSKEAVEASLEEAKAKYGEAEAIEYASKALAKKSGKNENEIKEALKMAETATNAATKVKTFSQLWDVMKEAVQSGWAKTWQLIIGDFEEAKNLLTPLADFFTNVIGKMSDARNNLLEGALGNPFSKFANKDEIEAFRELEKQSEKTGIPIEDLIQNIDQLEGRTLLINSFKNIGQGIVEVFTSMGKAWKKVFPPMQSEQLYNLIAGFHKLSTYLTVNKETADKFYKTFRGVFSILKIATTLVGGPLKIAFKVLTSILGAFDMDVLDLTANVGDVIYKFSKCLDKTFDLTAIFKKAVPYVKNAIKAFKEMIDTFLKLPKVQAAIEKFKEGISNFEEIGKNIIEGLQNGLEDGIESVPSILLEIGKKIISAIKGVLGIHSPSTVMYEIGSNIIAGLVNGVKDGFPNITGKLKELGERIIETFRNIDFGNLFAVGISAGLIFVIKKLADAVFNLSKPMEGLGEMFSSVGKFFKSLSKTIDAYAFSIRTKALKNIAISLAILVASIVTLAYMYEDHGTDLWKSVGVVAALAGILVALAFATNQISKASVTIGQNGVQVNSLKSNLLAIGAALLLMAITVKMIGKLDPDQAKQGFMSLVGMVGAMVLFMASYGTLVKGKAAQNTDKLGKMMIKLAASLLLMAIVVKMISKLEWGELGKGAVFVGGFVAFVLALTAITKLSGNGINKLGGMMIKLSVAMILMVGVIKLINTVSAEELTIGIGVITAFVGIIALLSLITNMGGGNIDKLGKTLMGMSGAILMLALTIKLLGNMEPEKIAKGYAAILAFTGIIALLTLVVKMLGSNAPKMAMTILSMSIAIGILAGVAILLSLIDLKGLAKGITAVTMFGSIMALMIYATKGANDCKGNIIAMSVAIGVMAVAIAALSMIDGSKLAGATLALSSVMGMFALIEKMGSSMQSAIGNLIVMTVAVGLLGGMIYLLAQLPIESTLAISTSLSMLLVSLAASMAIISKSGTIAPMALISVGIMTLIIGALGGILYLLSGMPVQSTLAIAISLSTLLLTISAVCAIMSFIPAAAALQGALGLAGFIAVMAVVLAALGGLSQIPGVNELISSGGETLAIIGYAIGKFVGSIVGGIGAGVSSALPEIGANLSAFMINLTPFLNGIKMVDESVLTGVGILSASIIALSVAELIDGIASFIPFGGSFADLGTQLSQFIINATSFIEMSKTLDESSVNAANMLAKMILTLTTAELINGISSFITGGVSFEDLGTQLNAFGKAVVGFSNTITENGGIDEGAVTAAANAGMMIAKLQNSLPSSGGIIQTICGFKDLSTFSTNLTKFGEAIVSFSNTVSAGDGVNEKAIQAAANAGSIMVKLQEKLPNTGGILQTITGYKDLATFGENLKAFGKAIVDFSATVSAEGAINEEAVTAAATAGSIMAKLQNSLEPTGGVISFFKGHSDLATFGENLSSYGKSISAFSESVIGIDVGAVTAAANAGKIMAAVQGAIPEDKWFDGKMSLSKFGGKIAKFGEKMSEFSDNVTGIDSSAINTAITSAKRMVSLIKSMDGLDTSGVKVFKDAISSLGKVEIDNFISAFNGSKSKLVTIGGSLTEAIANGIKSKKSLVSSSIQSVVSDITRIVVSRVGLLRQSGSTLMDELLKGMMSKSAMSTNAILNMLNGMLRGVKSSRSEFNKVGSDLTIALINGLKKDSSKAENIFNSTISKSLTKVRGYHDNFYNAGSYLVEGFTNGITDNTWKAEAKAAAMASSALGAAKEALDEHSPSKESYKVGGFFGQGFVNALVDYESKTYKAGYSMADYAKDGLGKAISSLKIVANSDIDVQPTIRPVLDLSDVEAGASTINGLFGESISIGAMNNVSAISSMMSTRSQNGVNDDVVSAIDKLRGDISGMERPSYTINGITYDDGSNVSNAVESLVRAARIERRM